MVYLRRMLVPKAQAPTIITYLEDNITEDMIIKDLAIGGESYYSIKFVSSKPVIIFNAGGATVSRKGVKPTVATILQDMLATDKDVGIAYVDPDDYANADINSVGTYNITVTMQDAKGVVGTEEWVLVVTDITIPVITLSATAIDVEASDVAAWDPTLNIASAVDDSDDVTGSVVITFKETNSEGAALADVDAARTFLGTEGQAVYVAYNYSDGGGNAAVEVTAVYTAIADVV